MEIVKVRCPMCGGFVEVDPSKVVATCVYCGTQLIVDTLLKDKKAEENK